MGHLCAHNALVLGATIDELYQKQVYPPVWKAKKVRDVLAALRAFKEVNIINKFSHGTMKIGVCTGSTIKAEPKIQAIANQVEKAARGLCLDCVRKGSTQATGCRIPHD